MKCIVGRFHMDRTYLCIPVITTAHGITGAVKIKNFMESVDTLCTFKTFYLEDGRKLQVQSLKSHKGDILIGVFKEIKDRTTAEMLRGQKLYIQRAALPVLEDDDLYYHSDLIQLKARLTTGATIGVVYAVSNYGAGDFLEILLDTHEIVCVPFRKECVPVIDCQEGFLLIDPTVSFTAEDLQKVLAL